jgi:hypothetical protein
MFRQYTKCYQHGPGDKPFNENDLVGFVIGVSAPGLVLAGLFAALKSFPLAAAVFALQYAATIEAVAKQWLYHRLVCLDRDGKPHCAIGTVETSPENGGFGDFDNDEFFDLRLMPHAAFAPSDPPPGVGPLNNLAGFAAYLAKIRAEAEAYATGVHKDGFQGSELLSRRIPDLGLKLSQDYYLHCEAEGNFWQAMKDYSLLLGIVAGVGAGLGALGGAAAGCAIGGILGPIGCAIGAIIGALLGLLAGGAVGAAIGALIAFNTDPGEVEDANVGDRALGPIAGGDRVVVLGQHVYDGFHEGWHEFHPLMAVMKIGPGRDDYIESGDVFPADPASAPPDGLTPEDMEKGLDSPAFRKRAEALRSSWCRAVQAAFSGPIRAAQDREEHRWTIHPAVDGCRPGDGEPPPLH